MNKQRLVDKHEMTTLQNKIVRLLQSTPGLSDRQITDSIFGYNAPQQPVNQACRALEASGVLQRDKVSGATIKNYLINGSDAVVEELPAAATLVKATPETQLALSEDAIKQVLETWLQEQGWSVQIAWARSHGIDIDAIKGQQRWIIEVKGQGSLSAMRVNFFLMILGETLQRMNDPNAKYSIALPDIQQYRNLWSRLPQLAKQRTSISMLFVNHMGQIVEIS